MAGRDRMTIEEVVRQVLRDEHGDVTRESVRAVAQELMEAEISELIGVQHGERRPEDRATHRNGYRPRCWDTRAGEIELQIPKMRQGSYFLSFLEPRKRSEQALVSVVQQAYVCECRRAASISSSSRSGCASARARSAGSPGCSTSSPSVPSAPVGGSRRRASGPEGGDREGPRHRVAALHGPLPAMSAAMRARTSMTRSARSSARSSRPLTAIRRGGA
jgi:hypothetical protein